MASKVTAKCSPNETPEKESHKSTCAFSGRGKMPYIFTSDNCKNLSIRVVKLAVESVELNNRLKIKIWRVVSWVLTGARIERLAALCVPIHCVYAAG